MTLFKNSATVSTSYFAMYSDTDYIKPSLKKLSNPQAFQTCPGNLITKGLFSNLAQDMSRATKKWKCYKSMVNLVIENDMEIENVMRI